MRKKGQAMQALAALGVGVATLAIVLTVTFLIISEGAAEVRDIENLGSSDFMIESNSSSLALNATFELTRAVDDIPGWVPLIVIGVVGAALLSLVALFRRR